MEATEDDDPLRILSVEERIRKVVHEGSANSLMDNRSSLWEFGDMRQSCIEFGDKRRAEVWIVAVVPTPQGCRRRRPGER